jgi:lipopolysaccharide transport system ATP-binding protein
LKKFDAIVDFADIGDFLDMPVQNYSSGMQVRLGFAVAAQMEPDVLIIDEVLAVGDVAFRFKCLHVISELLKSAAVIFVTHTMPQVFHICTDLIVLDHGKVTSQGRDLNQGVAQYLSLLEASSGQIGGSGEVVFTSLEMMGDPGETAGLGGTLTLHHGSPLKLRAKLKGPASMRRVRLQFLFWNAEMMPVIDVMGSDLKGYLFDFPDSGELEISAWVPKVELKAGKYMLSVIAVSENQLNVFCRHDNAAYLQVQAASASGAHFIQVAEWSLNPCDSQV